MESKLFLIVLSVNYLNSILAQHSGLNVSANESESVLKYCHIERFCDLTSNKTVEI